jgi:[ribosomal protein S18]-alanine N-acetyltransferase
MTDLDALVAIHRVCFADAWGVESFAKLLAMPGAFVLQSKEGFILVRTAAGEAEILSLGVMPSARRGGQAQALVGDASAEAHRQGATAMFLEVNQHNVPARGLYDKLGFCEVGRRKGYYRMPGQIPEDALTLRVELPLTRLGKV